MDLCQSVVTTTLFTREIEQVEVDEELTRACVL